MFIDEVISLARKEIKGPIVVGTLPSAIATIVPATTSTVYLSYANLAKQFTRHRDVRLRHYENLPVYLQNCAAIFTSRANSVHIIAPTRHIANYNLKLYVKSTGERHELYLTSVHWFRERDLKALRRKAIIEFEIKDGVPDQRTPSKLG